MIVKVFVPDGRYGIVTVVTDTILLPLMLCVLNIVLILKGVTSVAKSSLLMLCGLLLGDAVGYLIWGVSSKRFLRPDGPTVTIYVYLIGYHLAATAASSALFLLVRWLKVTFGSTK
jgi:hypothetical protein